MLTSRPPEDTPEHFRPVDVNSSDNKGGWLNRDSLRLGISTSFFPWLATRLVVIPVVYMAREIATKGHLPASMASVARQGLFSWDAGWYESIAVHGYGFLGYSSLRFFPLFPLIVKIFSFVLLGNVRLSLLAVANLSDLCGLVLLVVLVARETGDNGLATRSAWLISLAPAAFTYVMGYAEATLLVFTVATFIALRSHRWWWTMALGILAGLTRPIGILLAIPVLVEAFRGLWEADIRERIARIAAIAGGPIGVAGYLSFLGLYYNHLLAPIHIEQRHRGGFTDPLITLYHETSMLISGHHLEEALHLPWALLAVALIVVAFWKLPSPYGAFALAVILVALSGHNIDSFERYAMSAFPLVIAGAFLTADPKIERLVLSGLAASLVAYSTLAFLHLYVP